jgi:sulfatase modifying factor 1
MPRGLGGRTRRVRPGGVALVLGSLALAAACGDDGGGAPASGSEAGGECAACSGAGQAGEAPSVEAGGAQGSGAGAEGVSRGGDDQGLGGALATEGGAAGNATATGGGEGGGAGDAAVIPEPMCIECAPDPHCDGARKCGLPPSCMGLAATCGVLDNCCASPLVPGGTYNRSNDPSYPATVSDFRLDKYEVTVGRFRKFVDAYSQNMVVPGAGKNPNNAEDPGWEGIWSTLPVDADELRAELNCDTPFQTWTDAPGDNESLPMTCLSAELANAFCTWDGGRVPTEAEWNYAAAGGNEQRKYPWGTQEPGEDSAHAIFGDSSVAPVGSISAGQGRWGHADLAGNVDEWTRDYHSSYRMPCVDCMNLEPRFDHVVRCARAVLPDSCGNLPASCSPNAVCCEPPARGAFTLTLATPAPMPPGKSCHLPGATLEVPVVETADEKLTLSSYQHAVVQGEAGSVVQCSILPESPLVLSALVRTNQGLLELDNVKLWPDNSGQGRAIVTGFDGISELSGSCQLGPLQIDADESTASPKTIYGALDCWSLQQAPSTYCLGKGVLVLENCKQL